MKGCNPSPNLDSIVITSSPVKCTPSPIQSTYSPFFTTSSKPLLEVTTKPSTTLRPGVVPFLDSITITSSPLRRTTVFPPQNSPGGGSVNIIGPRPVYLQVSNINGPVIGGSEKEDDNEQLKLLLQLAEKFSNY